MSPRLRALCSKELRAYFDNPAAYVISIIFLLVTGYVFTQPLFVINEADIRPFVELVPLLLIFFAPAVTMRLFSEEAKTGTLELLLALPVTEWEILSAKFAAATALIASMLALTWVYPVSISLLGRVDPGAIYLAYLGLLLTGALLAAAGTFASTLTSNQVVAFVAAFSIGFVLYTLGKLGPFVPLRLSPLVDFLGWDSHLDNLARGVLDARDVVYYLSGAGLFLFLAHERLKRVRSA